MKGVSLNTLFNYLGENGKKVEGTISSKEEEYKQFLEKNRRHKYMKVNFDGFDGKLQELIEGIRSIPNYNNIKGYIRDIILPEDPDISYEKLSIKAGIKKGVVLVILYDLYNDTLEEELKDLADDDVELDHDFHYE